MTAAVLLRDLLNGGCRVFLRDGKLVANGPRDILTAEVQERLKAHKAELIDILSGRCPWCRAAKVVDGSLWWWCGECESKLAPIALPLRRTADVRGGI